MLLTNERLLRLKTSYYYLDDISKINSRSEISMDDPADVLSNLNDTHETEDKCIQLRDNDSPAQVLSGPNSTTDATRVDYGSRRNLA
ncbi:hypothetical protein Btru_070315 [Bulinus truncatus]|nr:hypothetical protein Btru_070315 [Bulinus truncatus]